MGNMTLEIPPPPGKTTVKLGASVIVLVAIIVGTLLAVFGSDILGFPLPSNPPFTSSPTPFQTQTPFITASVSPSLTQTPLVTSLPTAGFTSSSSPSESPTPSSAVSPTPWPSSTRDRIFYDVQESGIAAMSLDAVKTMMGINNNENLGTLIFSPNVCTDRYYAQALSATLGSKGYESKEVYALSGPNTMNALVAVFYLQNQESRMVLINPRSGADSFSTFDDNGDGQLTYYNSGKTTGLTQSMWVYYGVTSSNSMYFSYDSLTKDGKYLIVIGDTRHSPQRLQEYRFVQEFKIDATETQRFDLKFTVPVNIPNIQRVISTTYTVTPTDVSTDSLGNTVASFTNFRANANQSGYITATTIIELNLTSCGISPESGVYDISSAVYVQNTKAENYIESNNSQIVSLAQSITAGYSDPSSKARAISRWVYNNLTYTYSSPEKGALAALNSGNGKCTDYSDLFVAICRASGIPARVIRGQTSNHATSWGLLVQSNTANTAGHQWAEVYLPSFGWVTLDPTFNEYPVWDGQHVGVQTGARLSSLSGYDDYYYWYYGQANSLTTVENYYLYPYFS
jgi:transglutaminase-like putative cysteine protease